MDPYKTLAVAKRMSRVYGDICAPYLKKAGISQLDFDIIMFLHSQKNKCTASEICDSCYVKKNVVSMHIERLVLAGYIKREDVPGDRRKVKLVLSEKAEKIALKGEMLQHKFMARITRGIADEDKAAFERILKRLEENSTDPAITDCTGIDI